MPQRVTHVGIGESAIAREETEVLVAANLGSCLGITAYDPTLKIGGMVHCLLPLSNVDAEKAKANPSLYVDTGVVHLLSQLIQLGATKKNLVIKVAGGAAISDANGFFEIGKRNYAALKKILWKNDLLMAAEDIGGESPRTVVLHADTGRVVVKSNGNEYELRK